jgi:hypothetical protein
MLEAVPDLPARDLDLESYLRDYWHEYDRIEDVFWKLERAQTFREDGDPSWEAFARGSWFRALELNEADRTTAEEMAEKDRDLGIRTRRIRVVEWPISPYVQWEMHFFRLLAEAGQELRVITPEALRPFERRRPVPEIVILGERVVYEVIYDASGAARGARRIDAPDVIAACRFEMADLFDRAEPLLSFFDREIAPLPAPAV